MGKLVDKPVDMSDFSPGWQRRRSDATAWMPDPEEIPIVEQSHKESCDINTIMAKYEKNGVLPRGRDGQPIFGDFSHIGDYQSAVLEVQAAEEAFMQLPAKLRSRFDNNPGNLLAFMGDVNNRDEAIKLGLIAAPVAAAASPAPAVPPAAATGVPPVVPG